MEQILIVEDDTTLNQGLCKALNSADRQIVSCGNLKEAKAQLALGTVSLVLLDINLPDGSGLELLRFIKANNPILPVILLTANDTDRDIVDGLEQGADDYITKPFSLAVLQARVNTQLRKSKANEPDTVFVDGSYSFDFRNMLFQTDETTVELSKTEQKLLHILTEHVPHTVPRELLLERIWADGAQFVDENALSVTVKRLRDKLSAQEKIRTVYGIGYAWVKEDA